MRDALRIASLFAYNSCLAIFLTYGVFFTKVSSEFNQTAVSTSIVFAAFSATYSISSLLFGLIMRKYGPALSILAGGILMAGGVALSSSVSSILMLLVTYGFIAGLGTGSMWLPTSYAVFLTFDSSKIKDVTGIVSAGTAFGSLFFAPFEALLISYFGWRLAFLFIGIVVLIFTLSAYISSRNSKNVEQNNSSGNVSNVLRNKGFWSLYFYYMLGNAFSRTIVMIFVVPMLEAKGFSLFASSIAPALIGAGSMLGRISTSVRRVSEERIAALSFMLQGLSAVAIYFSSNIYLTYLLSFAFGIGYGGYIPQFALIIRKKYGMANYSLLFGILLTSFGIGASVGPLFGGYELTVTNSYSTMFLVASATSIAVGLHQFFTK